MKKICVVTGTRAEYGLLRWVIEEIRESPVLELQLIATGMHLSPEFGMTVKAIEEDGLKIDRRVEMLLSSDSAIGVTKSIGLGLIGFGDALAELRPDVMLVLGDRYELLSAATAALVAGIPIAHIHGGETTQGAFDEAIRHSITKMSQLHFVAAEEYRRRVIQLGEQPKYVFQVGGLGVENAFRMKLLSRSALEAKLNIKFAKRNLLITFHPVTLEQNTSAKQMKELLAALAELENTALIFTMPNADTEGRALRRQIEAFCAKHAQAYAFNSLGQLHYFSCIQYVDGVVGNSSSGLLEVPSFRKGTVNIGERQRGRLKAASVIDCNQDKASICKALERLYSPEFQAMLIKVINPYRKSGGSKQIVNILENADLSSVIKKKFYDLPI